MSSQEVGGYPLAPLGARFISSIIDGIILYVIGFVLGFVLGLLFGRSIAPLANVIGVVIGIGYYLYYWSAKEGETPGKKAMGLRVIKTDGTPITLGTAGIRYVGYIINSLVILIGWIWVLIDGQHQGWHDKLAGTVVVKVK